MDAEQLRQYLEFYQDMGIRTLYRREANNADVGQAGPEGAPPEVGQAVSPANPGAAEAGESLAQSLFDKVGQALSPANPSAAKGEDLAQILTDIGDCQRCRLHEGRNKLVFGVGNEHAPLVFVGEGPGADEDAQGIPFVGRAGQLLTQMIEGTAKKEGIALAREDVYICNVVKCRPPGNRTPEPEEMETCGQFLYRQILAIRPKALCALGGTAARALLGRGEGVTKMRGRWFQWKDIPVMVTYHPSYLLRPYNQDAKREAWEDLKKVLHFVYD